MHCQRNTIFLWIPRIKELPEEMRRYADLWHQTAERSRCITSGQRGEGVYDVAFEGLIKNVEPALPGDRFGCD